MIGTFRFVHNVSVIFVVFLLVRFVSEFTLLFVWSVENSFVGCR